MAGGGKQGKGKAGGSEGKPNQGKGKGGRKDEAYVVEPQGEGWISAYIGGRIRSIRPGEGWGAGSQDTDWKLERTATTEATPLKVQGAAAEPPSTPSTRGQKGNASEPTTPQQPATPTRTPRAVPGSDMKNVGQYAGFVGTPGGDRKRKNDGDREERNEREKRVKAERMARGEARGRHHATGALYIKAWNEEMMTRFNTRESSSEELSVERARHIATMSRHSQAAEMLAMRGGWRRACVGCLEAYTESVDPRATFCRTDNGTGPPDPNHKTAPDGWHDLLVQGGVYFCRQPPIRADSTKATRKCDRCERLGEDCEAGRDLPPSWTEVEAPMWRMLEEGIDVFRQQARNVDRPMADKMARLLQVLEMFYGSRPTAATGSSANPQAPPDQTLPPSILAKPHFPLTEREVMMCMRKRGRQMRFVEDPAAIAWVRDYYPAQVYPDNAQFDMLRRWRHRVGEVVWCTALPRAEPAPRDDPLEDEEVEFRAGKSQDQSWDPRTRGPCGVNPVSRDVEVLLEGDEDDDDEDDGGKGGGGGGSGGGKGPSDGGDGDEDGRPSDGGGKRSDETEDGGRQPSSALPAAGEGPNVANKKSDPPPPNRRLFVGKGGSVGGAGIFGGGEDDRLPRKDTNQGQGAGSSSRRQMQSATSAGMGTVPETERVEGRGQGAAGAASSSLLGRLGTGMAHPPRGRPRLQGQGLPSQRQRRPSSLKPSLALKAATGSDSQTWREANVPASPAENIEEEFEESNSSPRRTRREFTPAPPGLWLSDWSPQSQRRFSFAREAGVNDPPAEVTNNSPGQVAPGLSSIAESSMDVVEESDMPGREASNREVTPTPAPRAGVAIVESSEETRSVSLGEFDTMSEEESSGSTVKAGAQSGPSKVQEDVIDVDDLDTPPPMERATPPAREAGPSVLREPVFRGGVRNPRAGGSRRTAPGISLMTDEDSDNVDMTSVMHGMRSVSVARPSTKFFEAMEDSNEGDDEEDEVR